MPEMQSITLAHRASRSDDVLFQDIGGEAVLLDLASERYFGLNEVGTRIWQLIEAALPLQDVHRALCEEFDAEASQIERDMLALVGALADAGLITVR